MLSSWQALFTAGTSLEGEGVRPDVAVPTKPADFKNRDSVIAKALECLRKHDGDE